MGDGRQAAAVTVDGIVVNTVVRVPSVGADAAHRAARWRVGVAVDVDGPARCRSSRGSSQRSVAGGDADHGGDVAFEPAGRAVDVLCRARWLGRGARLFVDS